jgi:hypothetical protein
MKDEYLKIHAGIFMRGYFRNSFFFRVFLVGYIGMPSF